ncbi:hypothetical protein ACVSQB_10550 [Bradyrhizobium elkanii]
MLLVPVIGVVSAAIILGEPLGLREIGAMVLTLGGVTLALQRARRKAGNGHRRIAFSRKGSLAMRKAIARLDAEQRAQLLYLADLGTAMFTSALVVCILKAIVDLFAAG